LRGSSERCSAGQRPACAAPLRAAAAAVAGRLVRVPRIVPFFVLSIPPRARRPLAAALLAIAVLGGTYLLWFRDSSFVAIERVEVSGLTSRDAPRVREALESAARNMTTLHLSQERLQAAASPWPVVGYLRVATDFPNAVRIEAVERRPVAFVGSGANRVAVAADGSVLRGLRGTPRLPSVALPGAVAGDRLRPGAALTLVAVAGAAPPALLARLTSVRRGERGLVAEVRGGPDVLLGSPTRLRAKWAAAAAVLADRTSRGAAYADVRLPERPVAGGLPEPVAEPEGPSLGAEAGPPPATSAPAQSPVSPSSTPVTPQPQP